MEGSHYVTTYDIKSYETMTAISERYNKAVDKLVESVGEIQCSGNFRFMVLYHLRVLLMRHTDL